MANRLLLTVLLAAAPCLALAQDAPQPDGQPALTASAQSFDKWLGMGEDGRDIAQLVTHLHDRIAGGGGQPGLDGALTAADRAFQAQGGADSVQRALLYNGGQARDGLKKAYAVLKDYSQELQRDWRLELQSDAALTQVFARQADAAAREQAAAQEAARFASGMKSSPPSSAGGNAQVGQLSSIQPQEEALARVADQVEQAREGLDRLDGRLQALDEVKARVRAYAEKAGLLDQGAGRQLSQSLTGRREAAPAGSSRAILADALDTLDKASKLGAKTRSLMSALVARTQAGAEQGRAAETALVEGRRTAQQALDAAQRGHEEIIGTVRPAWEAAKPEEKRTYEDRAAQIKSETGSGAQGAASAASGASGKAAAAKAAGSTCPCAKKKAAKALGDDQQVAALKKLGELRLATRSQDGAAPAAMPAGHVDLGAMRGLLGGVSFDGPGAGR